MILLVKERASTSNSGKLTEEERKLILQMKLELNNSGVPRAEWPNIIQNELNQRRIFLYEQEKKKKQKAPGALKRAIQDVGKKIKRIFTRNMLRKEGTSSEELSDEQLDRMIAEIEGQNGGMGASNFDYKPPEIVPSMDTITQHGTFLAEPAKKKVQEVYFDEDDEEN